MILMAGDSWGCGELSTNSQQDPLHSGLVQEFIDSGVPVINLSKQGGANHESAERIGNFFRYNASTVTSTITSVIVWQTEWPRDQKIYSLQEWKTELEFDYQIMKQRWISRFYHRLADIFDKRHVPIYVIGGCSDALWLDQFSKEYPGVTVACQSLVNLLLANNHQLQNPIFCEFITSHEFVDTVKKNIKNNHSLAELVRDMELGEFRMQQLKENPEWFYPNGIHPNRRAQRRLFEFLADTCPALLTHPG